MDIIRVLFYSGLCFFLTCSVWAGDTTGGIKFNYTRIFVENLPIGNTISLKQIGNFPLCVTNKFNHPMRLVLKVSLPTQNGIAGFKPIPDLNWIQPEHPNVIVPAQAVAESDVVIVLPNDRALLGQKFHAVITATLESPTPGGFQVGYAAVGNLLFSIAPLPNTLALEQVQKHPADAAYFIQPPRVDIWSARPGQRVNILGDMQKPLQLINQSKKSQTYFFVAVHPADTTFQLDSGTQFPGNIEQVRLNKRKLTLAPGEKRDLNIELELPSEKEWHREVLAYLIQVTSGFQGNVRQYIAIYVHPEAKPSSVK